MLSYIHSDMATLKDSLISALINIVTGNNNRSEKSIKLLLSDMGIQYNHANNHMTFVLTKQIQNVLDQKLDIINIVSKSRELVKSDEITCINNFWPGMNSKIEKLGQGGFGDVYKYYNPLDKNHYALKRIPLESVKEVEIMSKLNHKNIVNYFFSWIDETPNLNIHMELCLATLSDYLYYRSASDDSITNSIYIGSQIQDGIEYLHKHGIIHGDLSSPNIFITEKFDIKLGDFGLSRYLTDSSSIIKLSKEYGNPVYRAPELEKCLVNSKSDIYSLGIILLELFTCFKTTSQRIAIIRMARNNKLTPNSLTKTSILPFSMVESFVTFIKHLLRKKASKRPNIYQVQLAWNKFSKIDIKRF